MSYRQRSKEKSFFEKVIYVLGFLVLLSFVFVSVISFFETPKNALTKIAVPIWATENNFFTSFKNSLSFFSSKEALIRENQALKERLENLSSVELTARLFEQENTQLKQELGRESFNDNAILATILVRPNKSPYDTLIIDVGVRDNVQIGDRVASQDVILLGEIIEVSANSSKALLYSTAGVATDVIIGEENISAEAIGRGGFNFEIEIPREVDVASSSIIMVPGSESFTLGVISEVQSTPQNPLKKILFKTPVNIQQLRWVTVIREI